MKVFILSSSGTHFISEPQSWNEFEIEIDLILYFKFYVCVKFNFHSMIWLYVNFIPNSFIHSFHNNLAWIDYYWSFNSGLPTQSQSSRWMLNKLFCILKIENHSGWYVVVCDLQPCQMLINLINFVFWFFSFKLNFNNQNMIFSLALMNYGYKWIHFWPFNVCSHFIFQSKDHVPHDSLHFFLLPRNKQIKWKILIFRSKDNRLLSPNDVKEHKNTINS